MRSRGVLGLVLAAAVCLALDSRGAASQQRPDPAWTEQVREATVAIGRIVTALSTSDVATRKEEFALVGTGVVFGLPDDPTNAAWLVTAKHVFDNPNQNPQPDAVQLRFAWFGERSVEDYLGIRAVLRNETGRLWIPHPNPAVDLAALRLRIPRKEVGRESLPTIPLTNFATADDVFEGASVLVLGYPIVQRQFRTRSIVRSGVIAWVDPQDPMANPLLIDAAILPGNSGGPVFRLPTGINRSGNLSLGGRVGFLGIVAQAQQINRPVIVVDAAGKSTELELRLQGQPNSIKPQSQDLTGLGVVEPASRVMELLQT